VNRQDSAQSGRWCSFLDFVLDPASERLVRGTTVIKLRPKSFQVLHYLVDHSRRLVTREELMQAVWGDVAVTDQSITKCIADIRKALEDDSQEIVQTVPWRGFIFQADISLIHPAEAPNEQPASAQGTAPAPSPHHTSPFFGRRAIFLAGILILTVVVILSLVERRWRLLGRKSPFEAIAVLPFESLSNDMDQQYMADGMTEALITSLGQASPLRVIARTSVNQYQRTKKPIGQIARELNVDVLVEGTFVQSGGRLRVTANLIQVSPERHIWAHSYERDLRDVLALQNEIASAIAGEIHVRLSPQQHLRLAGSRPVNPDAQLAYWRARYFFYNREGSPEVVQTGVKYSELAVQLDPAYAPAYATLAVSYERLIDRGEIFPKEIMARAKTAAQKAIALDEDLAYAHAVLSVLLIYERDWMGAEREARRAISLNPSDPEARQSLASYMAAVGRVDDAVVETKRARELDPFSSRINWMVGRILYLARRYDEALADLRQAREMQPNNPAVDFWITKASLQKGLSDDAFTADLRTEVAFERLSPESRDALRAAYSTRGLQGYWTELRKLVLPRFHTNPYGWYRLAEINAYLGDREEAFRWLEKASQEPSDWMPWINVDPTFDPLRSDPRFNEIIGRMGLSP
jgi:TolB-like protein/DNA-binding winged helix-turn-helix (wHTH) protein